MSQPPLQHTLPSASQPATAPPNSENAFGWLLYFVLIEMTKYHTNTYSSTSNYTAINTPGGTSSVVSHTSSVTTPSQVIQTNQQYRTTATTMNVTRGIRDVLYPQKKFLSTYTDDLCFSIQPNSICYIIFDYVQRNPSVDTIVNREFWKAHKSIVPRVLNLKRATVSLAIRKKLKGKPFASYDHCICLLAIPFLICFSRCVVLQNICYCTTISCLMTL